MFGGFPGDHYKLCWGHNPTALSDLKVEVDPAGKLIGPDPLDLQCTLGIACGMSRRAPASQKCPDGVSESKSGQRLVCTCQ